MNSRHLVGATLVAAALLLGACSDSDDGDATTPSAAAATDSPATVAATATSSGGATTPAPTATQPAPTAASAAKVSANNATRAELQAAFTAAGITGAAQWAREVEEYRPYPASDPNMAKLRQELAKYNPGPGVVDKIVATLSLP